MGYANACFELDLSCKRLFANSCLWLVVRIIPLVVKVLKAVVVIDDVGSGDGCKGNGS